MESLKFELREHETIIGESLQLRLLFYHIIPIRQIVKRHVLEELWRRIHIHPSSANHGLPGAIISVQYEAELQYR